MKGKNRRAEDGRRKAEDEYQAALRRRRLRRAQSSRGGAWVGWSVEESKRQRVRASKRRRGVSAELRTETVTFVPDRTENPPALDFPPEWQALAYDTLSILRQVTDAIASGSPRQVSAFLQEFPHLPFRGAIVSPFTEEELELSSRSIRSVAPLEPLFESLANATLKRVAATFSARGTEYGDTWRHAQWLALKAVARKLNIGIAEKDLRAIAAAVLVDVKYQRLEGGYKDDSLVDGIAYQALLAEEMRPKS